VNTDPLSLVFMALAHPARRAMLARLGQGDASVQELSRPLGMSAPAITKHLKVLERGGLISRGRHAQWRPCRLERQPMHDASTWIDEVRAMTEQRFDRLEAYLQQLQAAPPQPVPAPAVTEKVTTKAVRKTARTTPRTTPRKPPSPKKGS
jgi:DNA-binding transcriptional ArsR family regulator